jgi:ABC-2 type transport system permease protein
MRALANIFWLGTKELRSFSHDYVLIGLIIYAFTFAIYAQSHSSSQEVHNGSVGIVDEDRSQLSRDLAKTILPPYFKAPIEVDAAAVDRLMDTAHFTFIIDVPPNFERDVEAGRQPALQLNVDATAAMQAGIGAGYLQQILATEIARFVARADETAEPAVGIAIRVRYNPNVTTAWFTSVMPLSPLEIAMAKVWANGLVITIAVGFSLTVVVQALLRVPIAGSVPLFMVGVMLYLFFATAIGVFLGTLARSMPQLGLLYMLIAMPMNLLSGANTPLESMPRPLQIIMQASPSTHFVSFAQSILYRGSGFSVVWPQFLATGLIALLFLALALLRFRKVAATAVT